MAGILHIRTASTNNVYFLPKVLADNAAIDLTTL